jgi:hypothetical protein
VLPENYISDLGVRREGRSSGDDAPSRLRMTGEWFLMSVWGDAGNSQKPRQT